MNSKHIENNSSSRSAECGRIRDWMLDAVTDAIAGGRRSEFESHLRECAACAQELQRARSLLQNINEKLTASVAIEPSPALFANIRQAIAAEPNCQPASWNRKTWVAIAGACAAFALVLFATISSLYRSNRASSANGAHPAVASLASHGPEPAAHEHSTVAPVTTQPHKAALLAARRSSAAVRRRTRQPEIPDLPEVIVQPGQMQAVLQFVSEVRTGKINGAKIAEEINASQQPIEIKPLSIAPLAKNATGRDEEGPGGSNGEQYLVSGKSNLAN